MSTFSEAKLPTSFINEVHSVSPNKIILRSSITNLEECNRWAKEYGRLNNTKWNARTSNPSGIRFICTKLFVCHRSSYMKVPAEENKRSISKNSSCTATIKIKVKMNTFKTRKTDVYVKRGLFAVITINDTHNHSLNTAEALKFLPTTDCKETFLQYFNDGMGITAALNYHKEVLQLEENVTEDHLAYSRINPSYRVVQYWHNKWWQKNLGTRIGKGTRTRSSKTVVEEQDQSRQEKQDNIPLKPTIRIKEEPVDDYSTPSTSSGTSNGEFILPHVDIPWMTTSPAEESQITLSIACLNSPNVPESSDSGQLKKKQRTNSSLKTTNASASTSASDSTDVSNHTAIRQKSPAIKAVSTISSSRELSMNRFVTFGNYVANKLNSLDSVSSACAQKAIERIILEAEMGKYLDQTTQEIKPSIASSRI